MNSIKDITFEFYIDYLKNDRGLLKEKDPHYYKVNLSIYKARFYRTKLWFTEHNKEFLEDDIRNFKRYLLNDLGCEPGTLNKYMNTLSHFAEILHKEDELKRIRRGSERPKQVGYLTEMQQSILISTHPSRPQFLIFGNEKRAELEAIINYRTDVVIEVFLRCGLRFKELRMLTWSNIKPVDHNLYGGFFAVAGKGGYPRKVLLLKDLYEKIQGLPRYKHNYIFGSEKGLLDNRSMNDELKARIKISGINTSVSQLRHLRKTCGTISISNGAQIEKVAKKLGNSVKTCFEWYYQEVIDDLLEVEYFHPLSKPELRFEIIKKLFTDLINRVSKGNNMLRIKEKVLDKNRIMIDIIAINDNT